MKKLIFSFFLVVIFIFSCGKKGPIELSNYDDSNVKDASSLTDISLSDDFYTHRQKYEPSSSDELWTGYSKNRNIKTIVELSPVEIDLSNQPFYLKMYIKRDTLTFFDLSMGRIIEDWELSEITIDERKEGEPWNWDTDVVDIKTITDANKYYDEDNDKYYIKIDITDYILSWDNEEIENNGIVIYPNNTSNDYDFISFYSKNADSFKPKIIYETLNTENETEINEVDIYSDFHIADTFSNNTYNNQLFLGDGYYPIFNVDFDLSNIDIKWEILEGYLIFKNLDSSRLENSFDINLSDYENGDVQFYIARVKSDNPEDFIMDNFYLCDAEIFEGYFALNITEFLKIRSQYDNKLNFGILPFRNLSKFRFLEIYDKPELKIIYRENPEG